MDFLDYQTYIDTDNLQEQDSGSFNDQANKTKDLPEPAPKLSLNEASFSKNIFSSLKSSKANTPGLSEIVPAFNEYNETSFADALTNQLKKFTGPYTQTDSTDNSAETAQSKTAAENMNKYLDTTLDFISSTNTFTKNVSAATSNTQNNYTTKLPQSEYSSMSMQAGLQKPSSFTNSSLNTSEQLLASKVSLVLNDSGLNSTGDTIQPTDFKQSLNVLQSFIYDNNKSALIDFDSPNTLFEINDILKTDFVGVLNRKSMKSKLEQNILKKHELFLKQYVPLIDNLSVLQPSIQRLLILKENLEKLNENSVSQDIQSLQNEIQHLKLKKKVMVGLKDLFTLNQLEDHILHNGQINQEFFNVINKLALIKKRCIFILSESESESNNLLLEKINSDLQLSTRKIYNSLLDFLYHYNLSEINTNNSSSDRQEVLNFQKKLIYLSNDLEYFNGFLTRLVEIRSKKCLDDFFAQFDTKNTKKPIVLTSNDPVRYLADVLAYVHSLIVNEDDFVNYLLKFQQTVFEDTPKTIIQENSSFLTGLENKILNDIFIKLSNTIKIRLEQIIRFEDDSINNFEIIQLLNLYQMMYLKYGIRQDNALCNNLQEMTNISRDKIFQDFQKTLETLSQGVVDVSNVDLLPPEWLSKYLNKLTDFFLKLETNMDIFQPQDFDKMGKEMIEAPLVTTINKQIVKSYALAKKDAHIRVAMIIMKCNCHDLIKSRLLPFRHTIFNTNDVLKSVYDSIETELQKDVNLLQELQNKTLLGSTGLENYYNLFNMVFPIESVQDELDYEMYYSIKENAIMGLETIQSTISHNITQYLPTAMSDFEERLLFNLSSPVIADEITSSCFAVFSKFFRVFANTLLLIYPEEEQLIKRILVFTPDEVDTLIGV